MFSKLKNIKSYEEGFTLLELLLVIGISSVVLLGSINLANDWAERIADKGEARYYQNVMNAAESYVNSNFANIWVNSFGETFLDNNNDGQFTNADINNLNRVIRIGIDAASAGQPYFLQDGSGALPANFPLVSPLNFQARVYVRNRGYIGGVRTVELFVMSDTVAGNILSIKRAGNIASDIGPEGAVLSRLNPSYINSAGAQVNGGLFGGNFCSNQNIIKSIFGTWQISMDVLNLPNATNVDNSYCPAAIPSAATNEGGYVVMRRIVPVQDQLLGDVLYRVAIPGRPEANRMQANLDMNGLDVLNVTAMSADKMNIGGNLDLRDPVNGNYSQNLYIEETANFGGGMNAQASPVSSTGIPDPNCTWNNNNGVLIGAPANPCNLQGGSVVISGNPSTGPSALSAGSLTASNAPLTAGTLAINTDLNTGGNVLISGDLQAAGATNTNGISGIDAASALTVSNLSTTLLQSSDATINAGQNVNFNDGLVTSVTQISNDLTANTLDVIQSGGGGNIQTGALNITASLNAQQATVDTLTGCTSNVIHHFDDDNDGIPYDYDGDYETNYTPNFNCITGPPPPP